MREGERTRLGDGRSVEGGEAPSQARESNGYGVIRRDDGRRMAGGLARRAVAAAIMLIM